jgi:two-component system, NarL family, response regulator DesR
VIRILLAHEGELLRAAVAALLTEEADFTVVAQLANGGDLVPATLRHRPNVIVLDYDLPGADLLEYGRLWELIPPTCRMLVLLDSSRPTNLASPLLDHSDRLGFLSKATSPARLVAGIRRVAAGETVLEPALAVAALRARHCPFTVREREVLALAADGLPATDVAARTGLSVGTVRNYLSRAIAKTGARTRIGAIRIAQESGWL